MKRKLEKKNGKNENVKPEVVEEKVEEETELISDDEEIIDSDEELQLALKSKRLKPGLNIELSAAKKFVNNEEAMTRKLEEMYLELDWFERLDVTVKKPQRDSIGGEVDSSQLADNDFQREKLFFLQAQEATLQALSKLSGLGISTRRPDDYFAEMAKSDEHMKKIRETLLSKHAELEKREKVRKLRELKKMGKQMQVEAIKKKHSDKKNFNESISKIKKGDKETLVSLENELGGGGGGGADREKKKNERKQKGGKNKIETSNHQKMDLKKSKKTKYKESRYGFGGKKKRSKYNTAESSADFSDFSRKKNQTKDKFRKNNNTNSKFVNKNKPKYFRNKK